jgi:hypothetical protein
VNLRGIFDRGGTVFSGISVKIRTENYIPLLFADDKIVFGQDYEVVEHMVRKQKEKRILKMGIEN